jgi:hypothetical protein
MILAAAEQLIEPDPRQRGFHHQVSWFLPSCVLRAGFGRVNSGVMRLSTGKKDDNSSNSII